MKIALVVVGWHLVLVVVVQLLGNDSRRSFWKVTLGKLHNIFI